MGVRWIGLALTLVLVGAAAGYGFGLLRREEPITFTDVRPMPASSPSIPIDVVEVLPDPSTLPPLPRGIPLVPRTLGEAPFDLVVPVPAGWVRTNPASGEWRWYPPPGPEQTLDTYFLRVRLIGNGYRTATAARDGRIADLENAADVHDFDLEETTPNGFVASYVARKHRRVTMDAFFKPPDTQYAEAWIGVVGRDSDRAGLAELRQRIVAGAHR
jgi:hypothetical protein